LNAKTSGPRSGHGHRHTNGHEHDFEPVHGLPEKLPSGEYIVWQGAPAWRKLAVRAFHLRKLAVYFGLLMLIQASLVLLDGGSIAAALLSLTWPVALAALALAAVALLAYLSARTTAYTLTNRRVVMRVGIVLTLAYNLPFSRVLAADLKDGADGTGDIALTLDEQTRIAWLNLWPHARPWHVARPQPTLRCVPGAAGVAQLLAQHWAQATGRALSAAPVETANDQTAYSPQAPGVGSAALAAR
jgi:Bacterial PH domain